MSATRKVPRRQARGAAKRQPPTGALASAPGGTARATWNCAALPATEQMTGGPIEPAAVRAALAAAGALVPPPAFDDLPSDPAASEALEREDEAWLLATITRPLGLSKAVLADRG